MQNSNDMYYPSKPLNKIKPNIIEDNDKEREALQTLIISHLSTT